MKLKQISEIVIGVLIGAIGGLFLISILERRRLKCQFT